MQLWSDTPQAEGVVNAMIFRSEEILEAWAFLMEKRAMAIKGFQMFQSLTHRILDSQEFKQVIFRALSKDNAVTMIKKTLGRLGEACNVFKEFMQFTPCEQALKGVNFLIGQNRVDCRNDDDFENLISLIKGDSLQLLAREHTPSPRLSLLEVPTFRAIYKRLMEELTLLRELEVEREMPPHIRFQI